jgi:hypothetical protein
MLSVTVGVALFLVPFLLVFLSTDRVRAFLRVFLGVAVWHVTIALSTQLLHIFSYPLILALNALLAAGVLIFFWWKRRSADFRMTINWWAVLASLVIIFQLWSVHYFYTGEANTIAGSRNVVRASYPYPYFSDEWIGVALTNYSITNQALPDINPLIDAGEGWERFFNVFVVFFSVLAELFLLLGLPPLVGFPILAILGGLLISFLIYRLLRACEVGSFAALIATLALPYVVNGANLPGLWYLLPMSGGAIMFIAGLLAYRLGERSGALLAGASAIFLYPPLVVFVLPAALVGFFAGQKTLGEKLRWFGYGAAITAVLAVLIFVLQKYDFAEAWRTAISFVWRPSLDGGMPNFPIWLVFPAPLLPFAVLGLVRAFWSRFHALVAPTLVGLAFWLFYGFSEHFLIIDYARVAVITSWLLIIFAGLGLEEIGDWLNVHYRKFNGIFLRRTVKFTVFALFVFLAFSYTERDTWRKLTLPIATPDGVVELEPDTPANHYLFPDDLKLFAGISRARFLSLPWKALVVGAATGNYPLESKPSIVANSILSLGWFWDMDCAEKKLAAQRSGLDYAYTLEFHCPDFKELGMSREGLHLYEFKP